MREIERERARERGGVQVCVCCNLAAFQLNLFVIVANNLIFMRSIASDTRSWNRAASAAGEAAEG